MKGPALDAEEVRKRIISTQANIIESLEKLNSATIELGNPPAIRKGLDDLQELLTVHWLLYYSAMHLPPATEI